MREARNASVHMDRKVTGGFRAAALVGAWLILALIVVGCSSAADATASPIGPGAPADDPWRTAELRDVRSGETLRLTDLAGRLVVAPVREKEITLKQLLAKVKKSKLHGEIDTGPSVGRESW